nr:MAG TPA: hypothetical protein [Caudoviricetes sp.]
MIVRFCYVFCDCTIVEWLIGNDVCGTAAIFGRLSRAVPRRCGMA